MHLMTGSAGDLVLGVTALQAAYVRRLVQVTGETAFIGYCSSELGGVANVIRGGRFGVLLTWTVTRFAGPPFPTPLLIHVHRMMWTLREALRDVFMTGSACFRTSKWGWSALPSQNARDQR